MGRVRIHVSKSSTNACGRGIVVTEGGTVLLPDGPHEGLTMSLRKLIRCSRSNQRREDFRFYRDFLEFAGRDPSNPLCFLTDALEPDAYERGIARIIAALEDRGLIVAKQQNLSNNYSVTIKDGWPNYLGRYARRIRVLYQALIDDQLYMNRENPAEVPGWHKASGPERVLYAKATINNKYAQKYAGARFVVKGRQRHEGRPQNPEGVADQMMEAVARSPAPEAIKILAQLHHDEAPRVGSTLPATALGWSMSDFGGSIWMRKKWGSALPDLEVTITAAVQDYLLRHFGGLPHPGDARKTMMEHLHELAAEGNAEALDHVFLFCSPTTGKPFSRSGFRYWFQDAMLENGVKAGAWTPSIHFMRNCAMHSEVSAILRETKPGPARTRRLNEAGARFGHESLAWPTYVSYALDQETRRVKRELAEQRQREATARRTGQPRPPRSPRLQDPAANAALAKLPSRKLK